VGDYRPGILKNFGARSSLELGYKFLVSLLYLNEFEFETEEITTLLEMKGCHVSPAKLNENIELPDPGELDLLVIAIGPTSLEDSLDYPWRAKLVDFVASCLKANKSVLGIGRGMTLVAEAMGAKVSGSTEAIIGWYPIIPVSDAEENSFSFTRDLYVLHWQRQACELPQGARPLAYSKSGELLAFEDGNGVMAFSFHPESYEIEEIARENSKDLVKGKYIQTRKEITSFDGLNFRKTRDELKSAINYLVDHLPGKQPG